LRLAQRLFSLNVKVCYHIVPKFWAHGASRALRLLQYCSKIVSILPFEVKLLNDAQRTSGQVKCDVKFVGNPLFDNVTHHVSEPLPIPKEFANIDTNGEIASRNIYKLALIPGSRKSEILFSISRVKNRFLLADCE
jgi:lipid-A-disaccharide synthase